MKIALAQINSVIADFEGNMKKILEVINTAKKKKADLVVFPELVIGGYPPMDLLDQDKYCEEAQKHVRNIQHEAPDDIGIIIGSIKKSGSVAGKKLINHASLIYNKKIVFSQQKTLLPTYDVFDEARYFQPAESRAVFQFKGMNIGIAICEDVWWEQEQYGGERYPVDPVFDLLNSGANLLIVPSASPFYSGKPKIRKKLIEGITRSSGIPVVYVNMVGGNDSLLFDGQSMYINPKGNCTAIGKPFEEDLLIVDTEKSEAKTTFSCDKYYEIEKALVMGIQDYMHKCGFQKVHIGLSGGIDSALVATLALLAMGSENVVGFAMPSRYSSQGSIDDAVELSKRLGIKLHNVPIESVFPEMLSSLAPVFEGKKEDVTEENIQARIRGVILMAYANKFHSVLLNTGNKSELATGYCTLYGDMCGSLAVIGDLYKTEVFALCKDINTRYNYIPDTIITKPPSAELKPDQIDQDTLPPYEVLDEILDDYLLHNLSYDEICKKNQQPEAVKKVIKMIGLAEYKRRQAPPVLKVSQKAFGTGRRIPIARRFFEI